jgi:sugar phosphate permease
MRSNRLIHWAWIILAICFADLFINYSIRLGYGVVLPEMIRTLGLSRTAGGSIYNSYLFSYLILTPITGILTDRLGGRRVIACCSFILGVGVLLMSTSSSLWEACMFYSIVGAGATGMWTPILAVVQRWFSPSRRGLALGIMSTGYGLGFATMGAIFPWIVRNFSWRHAWYLLGFSALIMTFLNAILLRSTPEKSGYRPWGGSSKALISGSCTDDTSISSLGHPFKCKPFWIIGTSYFLISYSLYGITTFMVDYAKSQLGLSLEKASFLATIHGLSQVLGVLTILPLSDRIGRRNTMLLSNLFIMISLLAIVLTRSPLILYGIIGLLAVFYGATFPVYGASAGDFFPKETLGTVIGAWTPFYGLGAILSHWTTGYLRDKTGVYDHAFIITILTAAMAWIFIFFLENKPLELNIQKDVPQ